MKFYKKFPLNSEGFALDCPQVQVIHPYQAEQSDEISLFEGDVLKVLRKLPDGKYKMLKT